MSDRAADMLRDAREALEKALRKQSAPVDHPAHVSIEGGVARAIIEIDADAARHFPLASLQEGAERALLAIEGIGTASVILTAHRAATSHTPVTSAPSAPAPAPARRAPSGRPMPIEGVRHVIAIGSGKGGVGKSTLTANLAVALAQKGYGVALLDADIHGPSQPKMFGITRRARSSGGGRIAPLKAHGVTVMSVGLLAPPDTAIVWRGPMLMRALEQMARQVEWGKCDFLLVDLPPGTGDVPLTLSQRVALSGALVVSTPQDVALLDARKAIDMFRKCGTRILGMVENMASFHCPHCGGETAIFGAGGAAAEAERAGIPFLGAVPLAPLIRERSDEGKPLTGEGEDPSPFAPFREIADRLTDALGENLA